MRSAGWAAVPWRLLLLALLCTLVLSKDDQPSVSVQSIKHAPLNLQYFEDSDVVVYHDIEEGNVYRSEDAGSTWKQASGIPDASIVILYLHPFGEKTAFALTKTSKHYKTDDQGKTWSEFNSGSLPSAFQPETLTFNAGDPNRIIFNGMNCDGIFCDEEATYTLDGFKTVQPLRSYTSGCRWAKAAAEFTTGDETLDQTRVLCIVVDPLSIFKSDQRLYVSDKFFAKEKNQVQEFEPSFGNSKGTSGVVSLAAVKKFVLVATTSAHSDEMALFVTSDAQQWHRAMFPTDDKHDHSHHINQGAYTLLESTNYSIQIDVMTSRPSNPMGVIFTSNSNGTYFTENVPYTNRNVKGHVDFEKISGIQGIFLVNVVSNGKEVNEKRVDKVVVSKITFDDGRTFEDLKAGNDQIHLHSMTQINNVGRIFSSPAPGLVMGNGNIGTSLSAFAEANLYVSDNAGVTWKKALDGPHKYEFGDSGSILLAVKDSTGPDVDKMSYSLDHGDNWESVTFPDSLKVRPLLLTTTQDSTSPKFLLVGEKEKAYHMITVDFTALKKRTCESKDMEDWYARVDDDGKPTCLMGHKQTYSRRKKSADCFINSNFKDPEPKIEDCECTDADFECDYNFQRDPEDASKCNPVGPMLIPDGSCAKGDKDEVFKGSSGWRLIPGDSCKRKNGAQKDDPVERKCIDGGSSGGGPAPGAPVSGDVSHKRIDFDDATLQNFEKIYLDRGDKDSGSDETIIARPIEKGSDNMMKVEHKLWLTNDHGKTWKRILEGEEIDRIFPHDYFKDVVFFTGKGEKVIYTIDRGQSFHSFKVPSKPFDYSALTFHPDKKDWLIWVGQVCEDVAGSNGCFSEASISTDRGDNWNTLLRYVEKCEFTGNSAYKFRPVKQIVCLAQQQEKTGSPDTIITSDDFFDSDKTFFDGAVTSFATMSEFILAASKVNDEEEAGGLQAVASLDGKHFEAAHFPFNFRDVKKNEYTVLDSSTHAINLFVATETAPGRAYGSILKSNSNGTSYVLSASNVNCGDDWYVDFEKINGLEGVVLINSVANPGSKNDKEIQTMISHNDGAEWGFLAPPDLDAEGKAYKCNSKGDKKCALHLHNYSEREDKRKTFGASTAIGLIFGVGNVGPKLEDIKEAETFMSADGGVTWKSVKKGHWTWQYGDQGSIIVLVQRATHGNGAKTKIVSYSTDEGRTWTDYKFSDEDVTVLDITSMSSGTSRNFLLWCRTDAGKLFSVNLDFTGLTNTPCKHTEDSKSDYYLWSPTNPLQDDDCLFGHVAKYLRKKPESKCYNDIVQRLYEYSDCKCSRRDYECAYNFELDNHGQCHLVPGYQPLSGQEWCKQNPNETSFFEPTGYRKVPLTTCKGGAELDKMSTEHACKGFEDEFEKKHRTSGWAVFFAIAIPIGMAGAIGWYVWRNWNSKFGQIRLGDNSSSFSSDQPWVKYPVIAISAVAAVVAALPLVITSLWRTAMGAYQRVSRGGGGGNWSRRYTTRDSFARGRGDYSAVDDDEGELLGEESDEEV